MVDFTIESLDDMLKLNDMCNLHWIDHHRTGVERMVDYNIKGLRRIGTAGCELTWEYITGSTEKIPYAVKLLGRYDVWAHEDPNILPFQYGMKISEWPPEDPNWVELFINETHEHVASIVHGGLKIMAYEKIQAKEYCNFHAFNTRFAGHPCIAVNRGLVNSKFADSKWDKEKYDFIIYFTYMNSGFWKYSLFTDKDGIDVGRIAEKFGGGGHIQAAGFQSKELLITDI
jgi:hypothetical protein